MMLTAIVLDTTPLGLVTQRKEVTEAERCRQWVRDCQSAGCQIYVPEVADYEVRRELIRSGKKAGIKRLDIFITGTPGAYLPINTSAMRLAADLWAQVRNAGLPTADDKSLDGDVILVAQSLLLGLPSNEIIVATSNVKHISRFIAADTWQNIKP